MQTNVLPCQHDSLLPYASRLSIMQRTCDRIGQVDLTTSTCRFGGRGERDGRSVGVDHIPSAGGGVPWEWRGPEQSGGPEAAARSRRRRRAEPRQSGRRMRRTEPSQSGHHHCSRKQVLFVCSFRGEPVHATSWPRPRPRPWRGRLHHWHTGSARCWLHERGATSGCPPSRTARTHDRGGHDLAVRRKEPRTASPEPCRPARARQSMPPRIDCAARARYPLFPFHPWQPRFAFASLLFSSLRCERYEREKQSSPRCV